MKRPAVLIVAGAAAALLLAAVGASAHSGLAPAKVAGLKIAIHGDEASEARTEAPAPAKTAEPTEAPETKVSVSATEAADVEVNVEQQGDNETSDEAPAVAGAANTKPQHKDEGEGDNQSGGTKESGD